MANPLLETLGGHKYCRLSKWHFGFRLEPVQGTLLLGVQPQRYFGSRAPTLAPAPWNYLAYVELTKFFGEGSVPVACDLQIFSCVLLCSVTGEQCRVTRRRFEVTALLFPLLMFTQAFWAALDVDRGSLAEWHCWASL